VEPLAAAPRFHYASLSTDRVIFHAFMRVDWAGADRIIVALGLALAATCLLALAVIAVAVT
jgi:hypothetical protein